MRWIFLVPALWALIFSPLVQAECHNRTIDCYECDSKTDNRCKDPLNYYTLRWKWHKPPVKTCNGCCVKLVHYSNSPSEVVLRTCSSQLQINIMIYSDETVDNGCMMEGTGTGHMCFCEEDKCNTGSTIDTSISMTLGLVAALFIACECASRR